MSDLFTSMKEQVKTGNPTIVFPEGTDERVLAAANRLAEDGILKPIVIGEEGAIEDKASSLNVELHRDLTIMDPATYSEMDALVESFVERRKGKATAEQAQEILLNVNYFGTMLVHTGKADGLVSGAAHSTGDTVRPALQIIKTKEGVKKTSGAFVMVKGDEKYVFADCAINISPDSNDLAEIGVSSAETAKMFGIEPKVAMLSFSTKGSAKSPETEKGRRSNANCERNGARSSNRWRIPIRRCFCSRNCSKEST